MGDARSGKRTAGVASLVAAQRDPIHVVGRVRVRVRVRARARARASAARSYPRGGEQHALT